MTRRSDQPLPKYLYSEQHSPDNIELKLFESGTNKTRLTMIVPCKTEKDRLDARNLFKQIAGDDYTL